MMRYLVLLVALAWFGLGDARAQSACQGTGCDQGQAYSAALALANSGGPNMCKTVGTPSSVVTNRRARHDAPNLAYYGEVTCSGVSGWINVGPTYYSTGQTCSTRPAISSGAWSIVGANGSSCVDGCAYGAGGGLSITMNGKTYATTQGAIPTGGDCGSGGSPSSGIGTEDCTTVSGLTQCVTSSGKHCAKSERTGQKYCWNPNETGTKVSSNEGATKAPQGVDVKAPPVPPKNNGDWQQSGSGTASVTSGGTTTNYNVVSYTSNYGTEGQGGGAEGEGDGDGEGDDDGDEPGEGVGDLYEGSDRTVESVMGDFYNAVTGTQFISGVTAFMTANGSGSCPTFSLPATAYWNAETFDAHCSGNFLAMLQAMGWVVFAMACYIAVKIAVT